jgi:hypothetical protein
MPNWTEVLQEIQRVQADELNRANQANLEVNKHQFLAQSANCINVVKKGYLDKLFTRTGRNVIAYYSGFLSKPGIKGTEINDEDKNGFMMAIHKLERDRGLILFFTLRAVESLLPSPLLIMFTKCSELIRILLQTFEPSFHKWPCQQEP